MWNWIWLASGAFVAGLACGRYLLPKEKAGILISNRELKRLLKEDDYQPVFWSKVEHAVVRWVRLHARTL